MYCINCGTKNEDDSKFCINCGEKMEEEQTTDKKVEEAQEVVDKVNELKEKAVEPVVEEKKEVIKPVTEPPKNDKTVVIVTIVVILTIALLGVAVNFIYKDFILGKRNPIPKTTKKIPKGNTTESGWEISYKVPSDFKEDGYATNTLKMYKYNKDSNLCTLTMWRITYIKDGETEESLMREYSNSSKKDTIELKDIDINGKKWKYIEDEGNWSRYEYGMFSSDKTSFYSIKYTDYDPDNGVCKKYLDEIIKSITYNK